MPLGQLPCLEGPAEALWPGSDSCLNLGPNTSPTTLPSSHIAFLSVLTHCLVCLELFWVVDGTSVRKFCITSLQHNEGSGGALMVTLKESVHV